MIYCDLREHGGAVYYYRNGPGGINPGQSPTILKETLPHFFFYYTILY